MEKLEIGSKDFIEQNRKEVLERLSKINREGMDEFIKFLNNSTFFSDPASSRYHANFPGGLAFHSHNLGKIALSLNKLFNRNINEDTIYLVAIAHDLCKIGSYNIDNKWKKNSQGKWESYLTYCYNPNQIQCLHGTESALIASKYIKLTDEEQQAITYHMGAYRLSERDCNQMNNSIKKYSLVLLIQQADMATAYFYEKQYPMDAIPGLNNLQV